MIFHSIMIVLMIILGVWGLWQAANADVGPVFLVYTLPLILSIVVVPILGYRAYALYGASYSLTRDGIRLRWGLRIEQIPMDVIEWIHPADDLDPSVPLPYLRWPGAVLGTRRLPAGGRVEFLASTSKDMLVIATPMIAYAISPADPKNFRSDYHRIIELGTLTPLSARSVHPVVLVSQVRSSRLSSIFTVMGLMLNIILLGYVFIAITSLEQIHLGFLPDGGPSGLVPAVRLLLLPVLSMFFYFLGLFLGLFFYRNENSQYLANLLWAFGTITPILFIVGVYFILQTA